MKNKKSIKLPLYLATLLVGMLSIQACKTYYFRSNYQDANTLLHETKNIKTKPYLNAHLKNGDICILKNSWEIDTIQNLVSGNGSRYDFNRTNIFNGKISIPIDSVAIFETNKKLVAKESRRIITLSILAGLDIVMGIICLSNPKACFGSCPTFYINETDNFHYADAEGFSNAISPSMEDFDIDALNNQKITSDTFSITMKNEALETHCVNHVKLLAFPRKDGERVYQSPKNDFYLCENNYQVTQASGPEGEITSLLKRADKQERFSLADEHNLSSKEEIYLTFNNINNPSNLGLIINFRQTLMTTYFFYSAIGYMGDEVGDIFSKMETNGQLKDKITNGIKNEVGNIDIYVWNEKMEFGNYKVAFTR